MNSQEYQRQQMYYSASLQAIEYNRNEYLKAYNNPQYEPVTITTETVLGAMAPSPLL